MTLPTAAPGEIPPDLGKSQGGNAWRYAMMVNKGFIKPVERGQRGWKSEEEMRGILCFVRVLFLPFFCESIDGLMSCAWV